jgi:hypothetical protein
MEQHLAMAANDKIASMGKSLLSYGIKITKLLIQQSVLRF